MVRWFVIAVIVWLAFLTVLTLIAIFRHSKGSSHHISLRPVTALR